MSNFFVGLKEKIFKFSANALTPRPGIPSSENPFENIPRYPPFAKGLPLASISQLLASQSEILKKIELEVTKELFERLYLPSITAYCEFVHLLPASERNHHRGAGGLFRHGLEVALFSLKLSKHAMFDKRLSPAECKYNEPRWVFAGFLSGLVHDIGKPLSDYQVISEDGHHIWNPYTRTIPQWGEEHGLKKYYLHWQENRYRKHESLSSVVAKRVITDEALDYLSTTGSLIIRNVFECITNQPAYDNKLYELVKQSDHNSTKRDLATANLRGEDANLAIPVDKYLIDGIKRLNIRNGWGNDFIKTPPLIFVNNHLFITAKAIKRLTEELSDSKIPGIPWDQKALTDSLVNTGFAIHRDIGDGSVSNVWPLISTDSDRTIWAVKFKEWSCVFPDKPIEDTAYALLSEPETTNPEVSHRKVDEPETTKPKVSRRKVDEPETTKPEVSHRKVDEPETTKPKVSHRKVDEPETTKPKVSHRKVDEPETTKPKVSRRKVDEPEATKPKVSRRKVETLPVLNKNIIQNLTAILKDLRPPAFESNQSGGLVIYIDKIPEKHGSTKEIIDANKEGLLSNDVGGFFHVLEDRAFLKISAEYAKAVLEVKKEADLVPAQPIPPKRQARQKKMADNAIKRHREVPIDFDPNSPPSINNSEESTTTPIIVDKDSDIAANTTFYDSKPLSKKLDNSDNKTKCSVSQQQDTDKLARLSRVVGNSPAANKAIKAYTEEGESIGEVFNNVRLVFKDDRFVLKQVENIYMDKN